VLKQIQRCLIVFFHIYIAVLRATQDNIYLFELIKRVERARRRTVRNFCIAMIEGIIFEIFNTFKKMSSNF
jgi:hypothetical protein